MKRIFDIIDRIPIRRILLGRQISSERNLSLCRGALFLTIPGSILIHLLIFFESGEIKKIWTTYTLFIQLPGFTIAYLIARIGDMKSLVYAYAVFTAALLLHWMFAVNANAEIVHFHNYYTYLPIAGLSLLCYCFAYIQSPKAISVLGFINVAFIFSYPLLIDPNALNQLQAFVCYILILSIVLSFYPFTEYFKMLFVENQEKDEQLNHANRLGVIGRAASSIAHDYNNLLFIAMNNLESIDRKAYPELWNNELSNIAKSIEHASSISRKLLKIGSTNIEKQHLNIAIFFRELKSFLESLVSSRITITLVDIENVSILVNREELESAIVNIVLNAQNAMVTDGGEIKIYTMLNDHMVSLIVEDDGPGIPKHLESKIFEPYFSTKNEELSSGLGLHIVRAFLENAGGKVRFDTRPGCTKFYLDIPIVTNFDDKPRDRPIHVTKKQKFNKILIVDDNMSLLKSANLLLDTAGFVAFSTDDWAKASQLLEDHQDIDVVFIDLTMPEGLGTELGKALIEISSSPIYILLTGSVISDELKSQCLKIGFSHVANKPINLLNYIKNLDA